MNYMLIENNTLSSMKKTFNEYVKSDVDDVSPLFTKQGHAKNITCMMYIIEKVLTASPPEFPHFSLHFFMLVSIAFEEKLVSILAPSQKPFRDFFS